MGGWRVGAMERQREDVDGGKKREAVEGEGEREGLLKSGKKTEEMMEEGKRWKALDQRLIKREREKEDTYSSQIGNQ